MRKPIIRLIGVFMCIIFLVGVMPKELIHHALFDHEDDIHPLYGKGELVITKKHNHCSFLSFEYAPFIAPEAPVVFFTAVVVYTGFIASRYQFRYLSAVFTLLGRGPPAFSLFLKSLNVS